MKVVNKVVKEIALDSGFENQILAAMASFDRYAMAIIPLYKATYFDVEQSRILMEWLIEFYKVRGRVVGDNLSAMVEIKQKEIPDVDLGRVVAQLTQIVSYNFSSNIDVDYLINETVEYFNRKRWSKLKEEVDRLYSNNKPKEAGELLVNYTNLTVEPCSFIDFETSKRLLAECTDKPLFELPGALGDLVNNDFIPGGFISLLAPEKSGKSFFLLELAKRAARAGLNPLFIDTGDMSYPEIIQRYLCNVYKKCMAGGVPRYTPVLDCELNADNSCKKKKRENKIALSYPDEDDESNEKKYNTVNIGQILDLNPKYKPCSLCKYDFDTFKGSVYWRKWKGDYFYKSELYSWWVKRVESGKKDPIFMKKVAMTLSVPQLEIVFKDIFTAYHFTPRVLIIDYADLLVSHTFERDTRSQINTIWASLRSFAAKYNLLLITASQADARSYNKNLLDISNFSEDKRKNAHVTAIWGLNSMIDDRAKMTIRINKLLSRQGHVDPRKTVTVLQNLACANPLIDSFYTGGLKNY